MWHRMCFYLCAVSQIIEISRTAVVNYHEINNWLMGTILQKTDSKKMDPNICFLNMVPRDLWVYSDFLREFWDCGVIEATPAVSSTAGGFFVRRKDGRLRLILATRVPNTYVATPPVVTLASGDALAELDLSVTDCAFIDGADVEVCLAPV